MLPPDSVKLGVAPRLTVAVSLSVTVVLISPPLPIPASKRRSKLPPLAPARVMVKFSLPSASASSIVAMLKLALLLPARMLTVVLPLKSLPLAAVPL